jgi:hypothetical protein
VLFLRKLKGDALRLVTRQQLGRRAPSRLILEIDIGQLLAAAILDDEGGLQFLDSPWRREAALGHRSAVFALARHLPDCKWPHYAEHQGSPVAMFVPKNGTGHSDYKPICVRYRPQSSSASRVIAGAALPARHIGQLSDIRRDPPRLFAGENSKKAPLNQKRTIHC